MHKYRELNESIHVPVGLDQRVLAAAREQEKSRRRGGALRIAVCAACALALVAGGFRLRPGETAPSITYEFGLTVSAADMTQGANGGIIFRWMENCGHFRVTGTGIKSITLATDRGELWRAGESLGSSVTEDFDPAAIYGLAPKAGEGLDSLDGATLTLTAADENGQEQTETYHLTAETIRTFVNENGEEVLVPALAGDDQAAEPALYAADADSRWLTWPVAGSNTVSLSFPYGLRETPGGTVFHAGIDIPGEAGLDITAAMGGTVTETGFDPERGNYLVLDHGDGLTTLYGQCREVLAAEGETVEAGATVAALGSTGMSTGPHLHFEVRQDGEAQNPVAYFDKTVRDTLKME